MLAALLSRRPEAIIMWARRDRRWRQVAAACGHSGRGDMGSSGGADRRRRRLRQYQAGLRSRGIWSRKAVGSWRSSAATIQGTRRWNGFKDTALELGAKLPRRLILERNASGSVAALANLPGVDACLRPMTRTPSVSWPACAPPDCSGLARPRSSRSPSLDWRSEMGRLIAPALSTIRVHGDAIGRTAAKLMMTRSGPRQVDLGFELVLRDSG